MKKVILFDLDGVLIDAKSLHYEALNKSLPNQYKITQDEHHNFYDGRKTLDKLKLLSKHKNLPIENHSKIYETKQQLTINLISQLTPNVEILDLFKELYSQGYKIGVCSNSIRRTVLTALAKTDLIEYCSVVLSNEDVQNPKPHPEIYWKAMSMLDVLPEDTFIVEDSPVGLLAAQRSSANYIRVDGPKDVNKKNILSKLSGKSLMKKWKNEKLNVLIPMAGAGSRFTEAGFTFPKPLIEINGKPMIQIVVENLGLDANFIFVVQKEHREKYNLDTVLQLIAPGSKIVQTDSLTQGAACTALLAQEFIDNESPLFFANSDQYVEWNSLEFMYSMQETKADGGIVTFKSTHPKWSFAKTDERGVVTEVAEKKPISDNATVGFYYWKNGSDFVKYATQMIDKNARVNNEFYVCPVFNEAIADNKKILTHEIEKMWGLGTPEDLEYFLKNKKI